MASFIEAAQAQNDYKTDTGETLIYREGNDVAQENLKYLGLVSHIMARFEKAKNSRNFDEERWLAAYRNFRGLPGPDVQFTKNEKSKAFIKITKTKVLAAYNQIVDVLFAGNKFPIGVEATPVPEGVADSVYFDPKETANPQAGDVGPPPKSATVARQGIKDRLGPLKSMLDRVKDKIKEGVGTSPTSFTWEPAKIAAKKLEKKFHDQLEEANAEKSLRAFVYDVALFGAGVYKGPMAKDKEYPKWTPDGTYEPVVKRVPDFQHVSLWDIYPDPEARTVADAEYIIQRHRLSKSQLRALKKRPFFRHESIDMAVADGPRETREYWESVIEDEKSIEASERYEVFEYWGMVDSDVEELAQIERPRQYDDMDQVQVNVWVCNGQLLRLVYNPFTPARIPYFICPYELNPYSIFGIGVAENMMDTQLLMNGFMRLAVDNAVISSNVIFEIDETTLSPGQDLDLYPGKIFLRQGGQPGQQIFATKFPNVTQECNLMFDKARQLADEATGIPSYSHGQGGIQGIGRTASGMSMLMGAAAQNIKGVVRNIDDYLLVPMGKDLYAFNMQFDFNEEYAGDLDIVARGTTSLMRNEMRSQKMLQFLQLTNNPMDAPWVKRDYLLRELAETLDIESDKAVNDPREAGIQATMLAEFNKQMGVQMKPEGQTSGNPAAVPGASDPTGNGGGNMAPGMAPEPGSAGFSGKTGGGPERPPK